jgi:hypothetical protein
MCVAVCWASAGRWNSTGRGPTLTRCCDPRRPPRAPLRRCGARRARWLRRRRDGGGGRGGVGRQRSAHGGLYGGVPPPLYCQEPQPQPLNPGSSTAASNAVCIRTPTGIAGARRASKAHARSAPHAPRSHSAHRRPHSTPRPTHRRPCWRYGYASPCAHHNTRTNAHTMH